MACIVLGDRDMGIGVASVIASIVVSGGCGGDNADDSNGGHVGKNKALLW